jgi:hypothetical protein
MEQSKNVRQSKHIRPSAREMRTHPQDQCTLMQNALEGPHTAQLCHVPPNRNLKGTGNQQNMAAYDICPVVHKRNHPSLERAANGIKAVSPLKSTFVTLVQVRSLLISKSICALGRANHSLRNGRL